MRNRIRPFNKVTGQLLVEAREVTQTPLAAATLFIGFLLLLVIDMIS